MFDTVGGLPLHPLVVHATVVIVPTAAAVVLLATVWPRFRHWAAWAPLLLSLAAVVLVPLSTSTGESLEESVPETALVERHAEMGEQLTVWVILLVIGAAALTWMERRTAPQPEGRRKYVWAALLVATLIVSTGTVVEVMRIGHSGAKAAWSDTTSSSSQ